MRIVGGAKRSPCSLCGRLELLEHGVEPVDVGFHERREEAAARVEPGAGHHPEVDLADGADALLEHQAGLDERLQRQQLGELLAVGLGVALEVRLAVLVEAVAAGLGAELAVGDELLHPLVDVEAVAVGLVQVLGDVQHGVEAEQVDEEERAHRRDVAAATASSIFLIDRPCSSCARQISPTAELRIRLTTKPGHLGAGDRLLLDRLGEVERGLRRLGGGVVALDDLDQRHDRRRVEVVEADDLVGAQRRLADLGDRQRRGVRGEDRVARA